MITWEVGGGGMPPPHMDPRRALLQVIDIKNMRESEATHLVSGVRPKLGFEALASSGFMF